MGGQLSLFGLCFQGYGIPIARIAAKLALGYRLDEIANEITGTTPAAFEPALDYVVVKLPRFAFEKFFGTDNTLGTSMKSVGEAMAIGRTFEEALLKAVRSLERGWDDLLSPPSVAELDEAELKQRLAIPNADRLWVVAEAFRRGVSVEEVASFTKWDPFFLRRIGRLVAAETTLVPRVMADPDNLRMAKLLGFSDATLAKLLSIDPGQVAAFRERSGITRCFRKVDTCAGEFAASTPYFYSSFGETDEVQPADLPTVVILGSGPVRIGQGIEFDACCVQAIAGLREEGYVAVMVNCNPETVSTDWDISDRLYFEPLHLEEVLHICRREQPRGVLIQFGGQTPLKLAQALQANGVPVLGTRPEAIHLAEDRKSFAQLVRRLGLKQPEGETVLTLEEARQAAQKLGYPVLVRPSYVLGGRGMQVVYTHRQLSEYWHRELAGEVAHPVLLDRFLERAVELDVDLLADGQQVVICGIMEHVEEAGIHSGDSSCVLGTPSLSLELLAEVRRQARLLALELGVVGLANLQLAVKDGEVWVLEANPWASRTVPFVSKATGVPWAALAARLCCGTKLKDLAVEDGKAMGVAVKIPVFPFDRFPGVDPVLGPEMRSTGEVMGLGQTFGEAFAKAATAAGITLPKFGNVFLSLADPDKPRAKALASRFQELGFGLLATGGTAAVLRQAGFAVKTVKKVSEGRPHAVDLMLNGDIQLVVNTATGWAAHEDGKRMRRGALEHGIPYVTTVPGGFAIAEAIESRAWSIRSLQRWNRAKGQVLS